MSETQCPTCERADFSRYYCFDHEIDFESRKDATTHLVQVHETSKVNTLLTCDENINLMAKYGTNMEAPGGRSVRDFAAKEKVKQRNR